MLSPFLFTNNNLLRVVLTLDFMNFRQMYECIILVDGLLRTFISLKLSTNPYSTKHDEKKKHDVESILKG